MAGRSTSEIAAAAGCNPRHVQRLAEEADTQFLITEMMRPHRKRLAQLASRAVVAVSSALVAKDGKKADHLVRLRAVHRFAQLAQLAQGGKDVTPDEDRGMVTWEEFTLIYRSRTEAEE